MARSMDWSDFARIIKSRAVASQVVQGSKALLRVAYIQLLTVVIIVAVTLEIDAMTAVMTGLVATDVAGFLEEVTVIICINCYSILVWELF